MTNLTIEFKKVHYKLSEDLKKFEVTETEQGTVTEKQHACATSKDWKNAMINMGGIEKHKKGMTYRGMQVVEMESVSPVNEETGRRHEKIVTTYKFIQD